MTSETGATMVEYGLLIMLIATVVFVLVETLGGTVLGMFQSVVDLF